MYNLPADQKSYQSGFTLVEMLVVVAIFSLLSSMLLTLARDSRGRARDATRKSDVRNIQSSMAVYFDRKNRYPNNYSQLISEDLFNQIPKDPSTGEKYPYATSTAGDNFDICVAACMELPENGGGEAGICEEDSVNYSLNESYIGSDCPENREYYIGI